MDARELLEKASDAVSVGRAFGPAYEQDDCLVIPVAWVAGGGGGGAGEGPVPNGPTGPAADRDDAGDRPSGSGGGFGAVSWPVGVYVVKDGDVRWVPALDLTRLLAGAFAVVRLLVRSRARRRARSTP